MIKFLGPRSKTDKSVGMYASASSGSSPSANTKPAASSGSAKPLSPPAQVEYADVIANRWERLGIEESEIDAFNMGSNEVSEDWKKIKL